MRFSSGPGLENGPEPRRFWREDFFFGPDEPHACLVDKKAGLPAQKLELRAQDGRLLGPEDIVMPLPVHDHQQSTRPGIYK